MLQLCICRDIEHLGSLESTQEARVAQGALLRLFHVLQTSCVLSILTLCTLMHELILLLIELTVQDLYPWLFQTTLHA